MVWLKSMNNLENELKKIDINGLAKISSEILAQTPRTNLGGLEIHMDYENLLENGYKLDWFAFTVNSDDYDFESVLNTLNYNLVDFESIPGRYFYNSGLTLGNYVNVYYNDFEKAIHKGTSSTFNIVFTGQGCTNLYNKNDRDIISIFNKLYSFKIKVTRIDIAFDDFTGLLDFKLIEDKLKASDYRSSKKSYNIVRTSNSNQENLGNTIYIGSARSSGSKGIFYARLYDKLAQYIQKNQQLPEIAQKTGIWQRYEISYTKKKADAVYHSLLSDINYKNNIDKLYKDTFRNIVEFLERSNDTNKSRWKVCDWWEAFLSYDEKYKFINHERDLNIGSLLEWLKVCVMPNIKILELICDEFGYDLYTLLRDFNLKKGFSKKQNRLYHESKEIDAEVFNAYIKEFMGVENVKNL
jgi:phage replication initiation protein